MFPYMYIPLLPEEYICIHMCLKNQVLQTNWAVIEHVHKWKKEEGMGG